MKSLLLAGAALLALCVQAPAAQITLGPVNGSVTFAGNGNGTLDYTAPMLTGSATDTTESTVGSFSVSAVSFATGAAVNGVFGASGTPSSSFSYTNGANHLSETLTYTDLADGSSNPPVNWNALVTAASGSPAFLAAFGPPAGSVGDMITDIVGTTLDNLAATKSSESITISDGEDIVTPLTRTIGVIEPMSILVFGTGLVGLALLRWRS